MEGEEDLLEEEEEEEETPMEESRPARKRAAISAMGKRSMTEGDSSPTKTDQTPTKVKDQVIECDFCPMKFHKWSAFYVHRCMHTGEKPSFPCNICKGEFPNIKGSPSLAKIFI